MGGTDETCGDISSAQPIRAPKGDEVVYAWISRAQEVMAFRIAGRLVACSAICPHMGARLALDRRRGQIVCPWHGLRFSLPDGDSDHHRYRRLRMLPATECDGHVDVQ